MGVLEERKKVCNFLEKITGLPWQPYLQDPSKGPEQNILFYESPIIERGAALTYNDAFAVLDAFVDAGLTDYGQGDISLIGLELQDGKPNSHLACAVTMRKEFAENASVRAKIITDLNIQRAFVLVRNAPVFSGVATADRHFWEGAPIEQVAHEIRHALS